METQNIIENIENIENVVITVKKKLGRPFKGMEKPKVVNLEPKKHGRPTTAWRHRPDGTYNSSAIDPEYAKKYWRSHYREHFTCEICGTELNCCGAIHRHQRALYCQKEKLKKEALASNIN